MCSITPETANVGSSYNRMRGPGGCWFSDRSNCSQWSFNPNIYTDQWEPIVIYHSVTFTGPYTTMQPTLLTSWLQLLPYKVKTTEVCTVAAVNIPLFTLSFKTIQLNVVCNIAAILFRSQCVIAQGWALLIKPSYFTWTLGLNFKFEQRFDKTLRYRVISELQLVSCSGERKHKKYKVPLSAQTPLIKIFSTQILLRKMGKNLASSGRRKSPKNLR